MVDYSKPIQVRAGDKVWPAMYEGADTFCDGHPHAVHFDRYTWYFRDDGTRRGDGYRVENVPAGFEWSGPGWYPTRNGGERPAYGKSDHPTFPIVGVDDENDATSWRSDGRVWSDHDTPYDLIGPRIRPLEGESPLAISDMAMKHGRRLADLPIGVMGESAVNAFAAIVQCAIDEASEGAGTTYSKIANELQEELKELRERVKEAEAENAELREQLPDIAVASGQEHCANIGSLTVTMLPGLDETSNVSQVKAALEKLLAPPSQEWHKGSDPHSGVGWYVVAHLNGHSCVGGYCGQHGWLTQAAARMGTLAAVGPVIPARPHWPALEPLPEPLPPLPEVKRGWCNWQGETVAFAHIGQSWRLFRGGEVVFGSGDFFGTFEECVTDIRYEGEGQC